MNKETLEEVALKLYPEDWYWREREIFIKGAKWQQERSYSEEDLREAILTSFFLGVDRGNYSKELEDKLIEQFKKK